MAVFDPHPRITAARARWSGRRPAFEGWFFKAVDAARRDCVAVIPGRFLSANPGEDYAFVQVYDGATGRVFCEQFGEDNFEAHSEAGMVRVGANCFSPQGLTLQMPEAGIHGSLELAGLTEWPPGLLGTRVMGWFAWIPGLQCYHEVISLGHRIDGVLSVGTHKRDLSGGRGYLEKNWGTSFPDAWVWLQCNHFENPKVALFLALARVPLFGASIRGLTAGFLDGRDFYRLGSYNGARLISGAGGQGSLSLKIGTRSLILDVTVTTTGRTTPRDRVLVPKAEGLRPGVAEVLDAKVECRLSKKGKVLFHGTGVCAAVDAVRPDRLLGPDWIGGDFA